MTDLATNVVHHGNLETLGACNPVAAVEQGKGA